MRKMKILLSLFILLLVFSPNTFAAKNEVIKVSMNGSNVSVREVPIILNGQAVVLDDPSFIHIDRTLVPLRYVAETFGANVDWIQKTKTAVVTLNNKKVNLTIDSPNVTIDKDIVILDANSIPKLVTFANRDDARTMVPVRFISEVFGFEVGFDEEKQQPFINSEKEEEEEDEAIELLPEIDIDKDKDKEKDKEEDKNIITPEEMKNLNGISDIYLETINGKQAIVVEGTKQAKYNITRLSNPERVIIDIMDSAFIKGDYFEYDYDVSFVKRIRASQFAGDNNSTPGQRIVRVVLDAKDGEIDPNVNIELKDGKMFIYPKKSIWENLNYDVNNNVISLFMTDKTIYNLNYDPITKTLDVVLPAGFDAFDQDKVKVQTGLIDTIEIEKNSAETRVKIQFTRSIEFELLSDEIDNKILFSIKGINNRKPSDIVIVVDPGHGGADPGASSPNKVREKDLNLVMGLKLEEALKALGYNVVMTRSADVAVGLYDRPALANEINADIFISMHANSTTSSSVSGIEILYCPETSKIKNGVDQHSLAKFVMEEVLKATGGKETRINKRPDLVVLNTTRMPAILIETGFISNAEDEKLITNDIYQNKFIHGILTGVDRYFTMY